MGDDYIKEKREAALYGGWLAKYQHVERLGNEEVEGLLDGDVVIQTKLDGANLTVAWDAEKGLLIASRNQCVSVGGHPANGFNGAVEYVIDHPGITKLVRGGLTLRGEWLVRHSINYSKEFFKRLYIFDVQTHDGEYLKPAIYSSLLDQENILYIKPLAILQNPKPEDLVPYVQGQDEFGSQQKEGIVIKRYDFKNKFGRTVWAKLVSEDFREKNKLMFTPNRFDAIELHFASEFVTPEIVHKVIHKISDQEGRPAKIQDMPKILGIVYYDAFKEELWDFVKANKVNKFDFREMRRLVEHKTRDIALAYFNGIPMMEKTGNNP